MSIPINQQKYFLSVRHIAVSPQRKRGKIVQLNKNKHIILTYKDSLKIFLIQIITKNAYWVMSIEF